MTKKQGKQHIIFFCLLAVLVALICIRATEPAAYATAPEVDTDGLKIHETAATAYSPVKTAETAIAETITTAARTICTAIEEKPVKPVYNVYFTETDAQAVAQMLWGEARGCTLADKQNCVRTVCNRADDDRFPDTPYAVVSQYYQYLGYSESNPIDPELYEIAVDILTDWSLSKQGVNCEWNNYNSFWGDGTQNHFYTV